MVSTPAETASLYGPRHPGGEYNGGIDVGGIDDGGIDDGGIVDGDMVDGTPRRQDVTQLAFIARPRSYVVVLGARLQGQLWPRWEASWWRTASLSSHARL